MRFLKCIFVSMLISAIFISNTADAFWFGGNKKKSEEVKAVEKTIATSSASPSEKKSLQSQAFGSEIKRNPISEASHQKVRINRTPEERKAFNDALFKERGDFEKKYLRKPEGPRAKFKKEFNQSLLKKRADFENTLRQMPPDEKEQIRKEYSDKIAALNKEMNEKIRSTAKTQKEIKREEFEKVVAADRKNFQERYEAMDLDENEAMRAEFEAYIAKKNEEFYYQQS